MLIKERSIITWLLHPDLKQAPENLVIAPVSNPINQSILLHSFIELDKIRKQTPEWGLPELLMPSFGEVMYKSHRSFDNIMPQLLRIFAKEKSVEFYFVVAMSQLYTALVVISCIFGILPNYTERVFSTSIHAMSAMARISVLGLQIHCYLIIYCFQGLYKSGSEN